MNIKQSLEDSIAVKTKMLEDASLMETVDTIGSALVSVYKNKGKLLIAGNGGSAADAQHFSAEITCQYKEKRKGRPAIALTTDTSALTAWGNDHSFETVFARLVEAHGNSGDALILISTSGNSKNLIKAVEVARTKGIKVYGLLGRQGGLLLPLCDSTVVVPSDETPRIQECHILLIHTLCDQLDQYFLAEDSE